MHADGQGGKGRKLFILGLDGATFDLIEPWAAEGKLPNLARLMEEGVKATLMSTMPPVSPPAWCSFATGSNPGRHGVLAFTRMDPTSYEVTFENSRTVHGKTFWRTASDAGKRVGILNVPLTFPPEQVHGFVVGGMFSPGRRSRFVSPPELRDKLLRAVPDYIIECTEVQGKASGAERLEAFYQRIQVMVEKRVEAIRFLYQRERPDLMTAVLVAPDRASHYFWKHMDPEVLDEIAPEERDRFSNALLSTYQKCDWALGEIRAMLDNDTTLFVLSDHGFGPAYRRANLRRWLIENGYLTYSGRPGKTKGSLAHRAALASLRILPITFRAFVRHHFPGIASRAASALVMSGINWHQTKAYMVAEHTALCLNVKGRQPHGVIEPGIDYERTRDRLIEQLMSWVDPATGESVFERVYKREELYWGAQLERMPDLILGWRQFAYMYTHELRTLDEPLVSSLLREPPGRWSRCASHRREGIFLAVGPGIRRGAMPRSFDIQDLAPTALYHIGVPIPREMDGRLMQDIYVPGRIEQQPPQYTEQDAGSSSFGDDHAASPPVAMSAADEEVIREQLRDLGYVE